jgi:hypothetical protein
VGCCSNVYFQKLLLLIGNTTFTPFRGFWFNAAALILACAPCFINNWLTAVACGWPSKCVSSALASCSFTGFFFV